MGNQKQTTASKSSSSNRLSDEDLRTFWNERLQAIGRDTKLALNGQKTLLDLWNHRLGKSAHKAAIQCLGDSKTYQELDTLSDALAAYLLSRPGIQRGDRVAIMMPNLSQYIVAVLAVLKAGLVVVNCNPLYTKDEVEYQLNNSAAKILIVLENMAHAPAAAKTKYLEEIIITRVADSLPAPKRILLNFIIKHIKKMVPPFAFASHIRTVSYLETLQEPGEEAKKKLANIKTELKSTDLAFLQYTGGTTGVSKGARLTHSSMLLNCKQAHAAFPQEFRDRAEVALQNSDRENIKAVVPLPFYHIYSLTCGVFASMVDQGFCVVTLPNPRELDKLIKLMVLPDVCMISMINTLMKSLMLHEKFKTARLDPRIFVVSGGMPTSTDVAASWEKMTGTKIVEGYGLTEASPILSITNLRKPIAGVAGYALAETLIKLRDEAGNDLPLGAGAEVRGELLAKGPQLMQSYHENDEENQKIFSDDGFLMTGDVATISAEGLIEIVDRKKDMILVSGFNVYPNEIDDKAMATGLIRECAAVGTADPKTGEKVVLFAVPIDTSVTSEKIASMLHETLTGYKRPSQIILVDSLPKNPIGKILRREVRKLLP